MDLQQHEQRGGDEQPARRKKYIAYYTEDTIRAMLLEKSRHPGRECIVQIPGIRIGNCFYFDRAADSGINAVYSYAMCEKDHKYADHLSTRIAEYYDISWKQITVSLVHAHPPKYNRFSEGDYASNITMARKYGGVINGIMLVDPEFRLLLWYIDTDGTLYEAEYEINDEKVRSVMPKKDLKQLKKLVEDLEKKAADNRGTFQAACQTDAEPERKTGSCVEKDSTQAEDSVYDKQPLSIMQAARQAVSPLLSMIGVGGRKNKNYEPQYNASENDTAASERTALEILSLDRDVIEEVKRLSMEADLGVRKIDHQSVLVKVRGSKDPARSICMVWDDGQMHVVKSQHAQVYQKGCLKQYLFPGEDSVREDLHEKNEGAAQMSSRDEEIERNTDSVVAADEEIEGNTDAVVEADEEIERNADAVMAADEEIERNADTVMAADEEIFDIGEVVDIDGEIVDIDEMMEAYRPFTVLLPVSMKMDYGEGVLRGFYIPETKTYNVLSGEVAEEMSGTSVLGRAFSMDPPEGSEALTDGNLVVFMNGEEIDARVEGHDEDTNIRYYSLHEDTFSRNNGILDVNAISRRQSVIVGCGSGGGFIALEHAKAGVGSIVLIDGDRIEYHNICRHVCGIRDVGKYKTDAVEERIRDINPDCIVYKFTDQLEKIDPAALEKMLWKDAVIMCCTDNRHAAYACNRLSDQYHIPMAAAGCGPRASTGEFFFYKPDSGMPCYTCAYGEDKGVDYTNQEVRRAYYATEAELEKMDFQPGMALDIELTALFTAKIGIDLLMENEPGYDCKVLPYISQCTVMLNYPVSEEINPFMKMFRDSHSKRPMSYKRCSAAKNPVCSYCSSLADKKRIDPGDGKPGKTVF